MFFDDEVGYDWVCDDGDVCEDYADEEFDFGCCHVVLLCCGLAFCDVVDVFDDRGDGGDCAEDGEEWGHGRTPLLKFAVQTFLNNPYKANRVPKNEKRPEILKFRGL